MQHFYQMKILLKMKNMTYKRKIIKINFNSFKLKLTNKLYFLTESIMLNIYLIYTSSIETGDVDISKRIYTSFNKASEDIDLVIDEYITNRKSENNYQVINKEDFNIKKLNKDSTVKSGGYFFCKKKSNATIYKKIVTEGWWNGTKIEKIGKIGILSEINIPVDDKLLRFINVMMKNS